MADTSPPIAGWYPDPENPDTDRWWNGSSWSDQRRGSGAAAAPGPTYQPHLANQPYAYTTSSVGSGVNGKALAGLIVSLSSLLFPIFGINGIVGAILGGLGLKEAKRRQLAGLPNTGRGLAIAAIISGIVTTLIVWAFVAIFIVFLVWVTNLDYYDYNYSVAY